MRHATTHAPSQTKAALWISFFLGLWVHLWSLDAAALPLYATREGRTCDNCHINPNGWTNPDLSDRKCNLSCSGCHVDPLGGGLRTVSGRFYGESTLPMFLPSHRGWKDWGRNLFDFGPEERKNRAPDLAWGSPIGGSAPWAFDQGRYAGLNADPLVSVGLDARMAAWSGGEGAVSVFPMQLDTHLALHPVRHLTLFGTGGVLSKSKGVGATFERETVYAPKDVSLMVHQLPYQAYARVGRFIPPFGTRLDDHTSLIRRELELDGASLHSRVTGAELGLAPNYPYLNAAVFRPNQKEILSGADPNNEIDPSFWGVDGLGAALSAGWRDLGWSLGASAMLRRRALEDGGDTDTLGLQGSFNPWFYSDSVPLTFMAEYDIGWRQRELSGKTAQHTAAYAELDWLPYNGLNFRLKYDFADPDAEVKEDHLHRVGFGFDLNIIPNVVWTTQARVGIPAVGEGEVQPDFILILRGWL